MKVDNDKKQEYCSNSSSITLSSTNSSNSSIARQIELEENNQRRNENAILLYDLVILSPVIFDPLQESISCDSLESFKQLRLICKKFSNLSLKFYAGFLKTRIVNFLSNEIFSNSSPKKYRFVKENNRALTLGIIAQRNDLSNFFSTSQFLQLEKKFKRDNISARYITIP